VLRGLVVIAVVLTWIGLAAGPLASSLAGPGAVLRELGTVLTGEKFWTSLGHTASGWAIGLALSMALGVLLGLVIGSSTFAFGSTQLMFDFLRSVPPVALIPVGVFVVGGNLTLKIALIVVVCVWPVAIQTMHGVRSIDPRMLDIARTMHLRPAQTVLWILLPGMRTFLSTALRLAAVMALMACVGVELFASVPGLGFDIYESQSANDLPGVATMVAVVAVLGIAISQLFAAIERRAGATVPNR
jgi:ABC-type nitrate/sulfonate/bicarbonate transport system permease component